MRAKIYITGILFSIFLIKNLTAQVHLIVRANNAELITAQPGQIVTTTFLVQNVDLDTDEFVVRCNLPVQWKTITDDLPFFVAKQQTDVRIFSFLIPAFAPAGDYAIRYTVASRPFPEISDSHDVLVSVQKFSKMALELFDVPAYSFAGDTVRATFRLVNLSNQEQCIALKCQNASITGNSILQVRPGAHQTIPVNYVVPKDLAEGVTHTIALSAHFCDVAGPGLQQTARLNLVPRNSPKKHELELPGAARLYYFFYQKDQFKIDGLQGDLSAKGYLDKEKKHQIDIRLRGPDQYRVSVLGRRDEYYAAYANQKFMAELGDQGFSLSTLTEMFKYGRGLQGRFEGKKFSTGAFYQKSRFYSPAFEEYAAYIHYNIGSAHRVRFNYLNKQKEDRFKAHLYSLETFIKPISNTFLEMEASLGKDADHLSGAYRTQMKTHYRSFFFNGYYIRADENYPGYYQNTDMASANLNVNLGKSWQFDFNYRQDYQNADLDTTQYSAPFTRMLQTGLSCHLPSGSSVNLYLCNRHNKDRFPIPKFDYSEQSIRLQMGHALSRLTMNLIGEHGLSENHIMAYQGSGQRMFYAMASMYYALAERGQLGGYLSYSNNNRYDGKRIRDLLLGMTGRLTMRKNTVLNLSYRSGYSLEEYYLDRNIFEAGVTQTFSRGKEFDLRCRYTLLRNTIDRREVALAVHVSVPFNLPLPARNVYGVLRGRVINLGGRSCKGLVLHLDTYSVVTNQDGSFRFANVKPGTYALTVDPHSMGLHEVILEKTHQVVIAADRETEINVTIIKAASAKGKLQYIHGSESTGEKAPNYSDVIVELQDDRDVFRVLSDQQGNFSIPDIRPGTYMLTVYDHNLEGFVVQENKRKVVLQPGEVHTFNFTITEKVKSIIFRQNWKKVTEK